MAQPSAAATEATARMQSPAQMLRHLDAANQRLLDKLAPHKLYRWLALSAMLALFLLRMYLVHGFYIVTYVLFIFILNQFILFLQPKDRAALAAAQAAAADLPTSAADAEFRPFVRRLPEFKFWHSCTNATILAFCATFFQFCDVPVFWPVLVFYFIILFVATMRRQWLDMRRLKYVPWDIGTKRKYKSDPRKMTVPKRDAASVAQAALESASNAASAPSARPPPVPVPTVKKPLVVPPTKAQ